MNKPSDIKRAFFTIPFGRNDVDDVWSKVYDPIARSIGFDTIRIDERDNGTIKIDQIYNELSTADLVIGDLTCGRPNCYYEIGYAMAKRADMKRQAEIILCVKKGHKVYFDLAAYDVMRWDLKHLDDFKSKFRKRFIERLESIRARTAVPQSTRVAPTCREKRPMLELEALAKKIRKEVMS